VQWVYEVSGLYLNISRSYCKNIYIFFLFCGINARNVTPLNLNINCIRAFQSTAQVSTQDPQRIYMNTEIVGNITHNEIT